LSSAVSVPVASASAGNAPGKAAVGGPPPLVVQKPPGAKPPSEKPPVTQKRASQKPLAPGWSEFVHEQSGKKYYYNSQTKENVWDRTMAT
jgi:hypothetical protein